MGIEIVYFNADDNVKLSGILYENGKSAEKILISVHGMVSNCLKKRDEEIAKKLNNINIDMLSFNNRGHDIVNYIKKQNGERTIAGTAYEDVEDGYKDIIRSNKICIR